MQELELIVQTASELPAQDESEESTLARKRLAGRWLSTIEHAKGVHKNVFKRMRRDMDIVFHGYDPELWTEDKYVVNLAQRHVQQRTAALYAKNPRAVARPRRRLLSKVWDGKPETLAQAKQIEAMALQEGQPVPETAAALLQEYSAISLQQSQLDRVGQTLEILFHYFMQESQPSFKSQMKALVRRMLTTGVGFVKLGFMREMERRPEVSARMADVTAQIQHMERLIAEVGDGMVGADDARVEELRVMLGELAARENIITREGLLFDFPDSDSIIIDPRCKQLRGFVGATWIAHRILMTTEEVKEIYGVEVKGGFTPYQVQARSHDSSRGTLTDVDGKPQEDGQKSLACVYVVYDKTSGLELVVCEGYDDFLKEPAAPELKLEGFWPVFALVCNEVEHYKEIYPPSDVHLLRSQVHTYNQSREALREHRRANRPRYVTPAGKLEDDDKAKLAAANAHDVLELQGLAAGEKVEDVLAPLKMAGIDPNLYEVGTTFDDVQLAVGSQEAQFGSTSGATATETSVAESSRMSALGAQVDELDSFMSELARCAGAILLQQMSRDMVVEIVGDGAVWPELTAQEIAQEVFLEIEAGSTGKPNQAAELRNLERVLPYLIQIPGIRPQWIAKEVIKRLDDRLNIDDALAEGVDSIVAMNSAQTPQDAQGATQGPAGATNAPLSMAPGAGPTGPQTA